MWAPWRRRSAGYPVGGAPDPRTPIAELRLLAVDLETTGLDPRSDRVLSIGWVPIDGREIVLAGARSAVVRPPAPGERDGLATEVGHSAVHHGLTDDRIAAGEPPAEVLGTVLDALAGRVLLAHHARIELDFLRAALRLFGGPDGTGAPHGSTRFRPPAVDTMDLAARVLRRTEDREPGGSELRLWAARERYGLPGTGAHDALHDALACAELYLAQSAELAELGDRTLADLRLRDRLAPGA